MIQPADDFLPASPDADFLRTPPEQHTADPHSGDISQRDGLADHGPDVPPVPRSPVEALDLIPVRMLNEFTYCHRLGYLEFVHGEWQDNFETKQGTFGHRRVDKPDRQNVAGHEVPEVQPINSNDHEQLSAHDSPTSTHASASLPAEISRPIHARSIDMSAPREGLIAKLDLLELDGNRATPVDDKRGRVPKVPENAYEPERVQLCAQGLILRDNGYQCDAGVLYFIASKKRVIIPFDDALIARTRQLLADFRITAAGTQIPPPLVDSPKCPRCSLVGICLPDELVFLQAEGFQERQDADEDDEASDRAAPSMDAPSTDFSAQRKRHGGDDIPTPSDIPTPTPAGASRHRLPVRKLLAVREDALPFYVQDHGAMLGKSGDRLQVRKRGEVIGERRLMDVSQVSLFGSVIVSAQALSELTGRSIPICHFSHGGWFHGMTTGLVHKNVDLRIRQYELAGEERRSVRIARQLISGKIRNGRTLLRRHLGNDVSGSKSLLGKLERYRRQAEGTDNNASLLGIEGMAAKTYFDGLFQLMNGRHPFNVSDRNRRPPRDPVNAVLSFVYALLTKELTIVLQAVGFDPMLGIFHTPRYGRPSLALDMAEEYRPLIADSVMLTAFNNGELTARSFLERAGAVVLTPAGRSALIACFERRMTTEITHPIFGYKLSYRRLLEVQCRLLARTILGELESYPAFTTR
ncbi:MAG: CRISPR-associated endonuclease Cas1 [Planctomycetaceae bacterium]